MSEGSPALSDADLAWATVDELMTKVASLIRRAVSAEVERDKALADAARARRRAMGTDELRAALEKIQAIGCRQPTWEPDEFQSWWGEMGDIATDALARPPAPDAGERVIGAAREYVAAATPGFYQRDGVRVSRAVVELHAAVSALDGDADARPEAEEGRRE